MGLQGSGLGCQFSGKGVPGVGTGCGTEGLAAWGGSSSLSKRAPRVEALAAKAKSAVLETGSRAFLEERQQVQPLQEVVAAEPAVQRVAAELVYLLVRPKVINMIRRFCVFTDIPTLNLLFHRAWAGFADVSTCLSSARAVVDSSPRSMPGNAWFAGCCWLQLVQAQAGHNIWGHIWTACLRQRRW